MIAGRTTACLHRMSTTADPTEPAREAHARRPQPAPRTPRPARPLPRTGASLVAAALVVMAGHSLRAGPATAPASPLLDIAPGAIDWGRILRGQSRHARIAIINTADGPVRIRHADIDCPCIDLQFIGPVLLEPRGFVELDVILETLRQPGGSQDHEIRLEYGRPAGPTHTAVIPVRFEIVPGVEPAPPWLDFGMVNPGRPVTRALTLTARDGSPFRVLDVAVEGSDFVRLDGLNSPDDPPARRHTLRAHLLVPAPPPPESDLQGRLVLFTDHPFDREVVVEWQARVAGPIRIEPRVCFAMNVAPGSTVEFPVRIEAPPDVVQQIHVMAVDEALRPLEITWQVSNGHSGRAVLRVRIPPGTGPGHLAGPITLGAAGGPVTTVTLALDIGS